MGGATPTQNPERSHPSRLPWELRDPVSSSPNSDASHSNQPTKSESRAGLAGGATGYRLLLKMS